MIGPTWLADVLAAVMTVTAGYCLSRILVARRLRRETEPADIGGMHVSEGILTSTGGMTSHAAVVARGMGTPCVAGVGALTIDAKSKRMSVDGRTYGPEDWISLDGSTGEVFQSRMSAGQAV